MVFVVRELALVVVETASPVRRHNGHRLIGGQRRPSTGRIVALYASGNAISIAISRSSGAEKKTP